MNILITGASRGIGYDLVKHFCAIEGNQVVALSRNEGKLGQLKEQVKDSPSGNLQTISYDLASWNAEQAVYEQVKHLKHFDLVVNNAGYLVNKPFRELSRSDIEQAYAVNVTGVMHLIQALLPLLGGAQSSHLVNIGSMGGFQGSAKFPGLSAYSSSKAAVASLSECLAEEFKEDNIQVNCLTLGAVQTEMLEEAFPGYEAPLSAKEMAEFIADFGTNAGKYINGKVIPVSISTP